MLVVISDDQKKVTISNNGQVPSAISEDTGISGMRFTARSLGYSFNITLDKTLTIVLEKALS